MKVWKYLSMIFTFFKSLNVLIHSSSSSEKKPKEHISIGIILFFLFLFEKQKQRRNFRIGKLNCSINVAVKTVFGRNLSTLFSVTLGCTEGKMK